ncbi:MAG: Rossmann-like and DUF2520 domain-containing protein [bacterium]
MHFDNLDTISVAIIGAGRVGTALAMALNRKGLAISAVVSRSKSSAADCASKVNCPIYSDQLASLPEEAQAIFVTTPDASLASIASRLKKLPIDFRDKFIAHTSGLCTSEVLESIRSKGALTASIHPIQTFADNKEDWQKFAGIFFGIEGQPKALEICKRFAGLLSANYVTVTKEVKPLYHAACVFTSNYLVALMSVPAMLFEKLDFSEHDSARYLQPLLEGTIDNIKKMGIANALTGPIARGDVGTIERHLETLRENFPEFIPLYSSLGMQALALARDGNRIDGGMVDRIQALLA